MKQNILLILGLFIQFNGVFAQPSAPKDSLAVLPKPVSAPSPELKVLLNTDGSHYFKFTFLNQTWLRFNESNPGTTVMGEEQGQTFDIGLRRTRIQMYGKIARRTFLYFQFGQNNFNFLAQNAGNRKLQVFFHDAVGEYEVFENKDYLKLGAGLTITNGLSRFSQPSIGTILTMDVPVFAQATVDQTDEFSRKLSLYARGQVGPLDYRFSLSDPFPITTNGQKIPDLGNNATFASKGHHQQYQAYVAYQFWEHESHTTPYMTGSHLGKKKVFNIGAGIIAQPKGTWRKGTQADTIYDNMLLYAVESFLDLPLNKEKGTALTAYVGYFNYNYGQGYLRYNGLMNPANGTNKPIAGAGYTFGNAYPMFGTGSVVYGQVGYLLPQNLLGESIGSLQPYFSWMSADYERLSDRMNVMDTGVNWLISGHRSKLSCNYQLRPVYKAVPDGKLNRDSYKGCLVVQYQVFLN